MEALTAASVAALDRLRHAQSLRPQHGNGADAADPTKYRRAQAETTGDEACFACSRHRSRGPSDGRRIGTEVGGIDVFLGVVCAITTGARGDAPRVSRLCLHGREEMYSASRTKIARSCGRAARGAAPHRLTGGRRLGGGLRSRCRAPRRSLHACRALIDRINTASQSGSARARPRWPVTWVGWEDARCGDGHTTSAISTSNELAALGLGCRSRSPTRRSFRAGSWPK